MNKHIKEKLEGRENVKIKSINKREFGGDSVILEVDGVEIYIGSKVEHNKGLEGSGLCIDYNKTNSKGL